MVLLAQAIAVLATLKILDLSGNALGAKGARLLGEQKVSLFLEKLTFTKDASKCHNYYYEGFQ